MAGERRLRAIESLHFLGKTFRFNGAQVPVDQIPAVDLGELDLLAAKEAEYEENHRRVDLTWQEDAAATAGLAELRRLQAELAGAPAPQVAAIAQERRGSAEGWNHEATRRELIVAKHLGDPEVAKAKTLDDAFKLLKRKEETKKAEQLAVQVGRTFSASAHTALNLDSFAWMAGQPDAQFDVILTDPIYGIGADEFGDSGGKAVGAHDYSDSYEEWKATMPVFAKEAFRLAKPLAHLYAFCDITRFEEFKAILDAEGWDVFRTPLIWYKPTASRLPWVDFGPQRKYECILYAKKGRKPVTQIYGDVITCNTDENMGWKAQKPVALYLDLLRRSVRPGDAVLDPFCGSGPIFPAAHELKCRAVGIEQAAAAYGLCLKRLELLKAQGELPV